MTIHSPLLKLTLLLSLTAPLAQAEHASLQPTTRPSTLTNTKPLRVLFIGNSYTFFNGGLGTVIQQLATSTKVSRKFEFVEVTKGGQTLEGHWTEGKALAEIRKGNWDYVVLQEHSQRPILDRDKMYSFAKKFDAEIHKVGAKTLFFETWARQNKPETQTLLDQAYTGIAKEISAAIAPAGDAWQRALKSNPKLSLHITDLSHPTPAGTYLNACVFYDMFYGQPPQALPKTIKSAAGKILIDLTDTEAQLLQQSAAETCTRKPE